MKHIRRDDNHVAHLLAKMAVKNNVNMVWFYNPLDCIRESLRENISALSDSI
jgi:hypothetical protein